MSCCVRLSLAMSVVLLGRKLRSARALDLLLERGFQVPLVVEDGADGPGPLASHAAVLGLTWLSPAQLRPDEPSVPAPCDYLVSYLYRRRVPRWLLDRARVLALNFHPAPLPEYRGVGGYNLAILEGRSDWAVTAHVMTAEIDAGDIIVERRLPIEPDDTAYSLERRTRDVLFDLFADVMGRIARGEMLPRTPQGTGRYISAREFERLRRIDPADDADTVARKARAFWYPPHRGASVEIGGREFTLVDDVVLRRVAAEIQTE